MGHFGVFRCIKWTNDLFQDPSAASTRVQHPESLVDGKCSYPWLRGLSQLRFR